MFIYRIPTDLSRTKSSIPEILSPMRMPEFDSHFQLHPMAVPLLSFKPASHIMFRLFNPFTAKESVL